MRASDSSDAFFSDPSVQDFSIQDLLAHFRDVLGEEVTPTEELMFKVDELGLEFALFLLMRLAFLSAFFLFLLKLPLKIADLSRQFCLVGLKSH